MRLGRAQIAAVAVLSLAAVAGCRPSDPSNPETWVARLADQDAAGRRKAIQEARKTKQKAAAPALIAALNDARLREDAVLALGELGGPESVQPLLDAIDTKVGAGSDEATRAATRTNAKIADALGQLGDAKAGPALLRLSRSRDDLVRLAAVQALGQLKIKEGVPELVHIVDEESTPPIIIKKAIVALGQIGDVDAIPALQHALVIERQGVSFISEASYALFQLGPAAVEPMLKLARDENKAYLAWAKEHSRAPAGTYAKAALVLGDLGDPRAVPVLLGKLSYSDPDPIPATAHLLTNLVREFSADALGRLRAKEAAGPILALVKTEDPRDEDLVVFATNALVWIGDKNTAPELLKRVKAPGSFQSRLVCGQAAALLGDPSIAAQLLAAGSARDKKPSAEVCLQELAAINLGEVAEKDACDRLAAERGKSFAVLAAPLEAAKACGEGAKAAACWSGKLTDAQPMVRARAAYELGRASASEAIPALTRAAADADLAARLAAIRALEWLMPLPQARAQLKAASLTLAAQLQAEQGRVQLAKVNEDLKRLQARLARL